MKKFALLCTIAALAACSEAEAQRKPLHRPPK
jgi:hypothetical protein